MVEVAEVVAIPTPPAPPYLMKVPNGVDSGAPDVVPPPS